jgi:hypothetical protein
LSVLSTHNLIYDYWGLTLTQWPAFEGGKLTATRPYIQHNDTQQKGLIKDNRHKWYSAKVTLSTNDTQHNNVLPLCWVSHFIDSWMSLCWVSLCWMSWRPFTTIINTELLDVTVLIPLSFFHPIIIFLQHWCFNFMTYNNYY